MEGEGYVVTEDAEEEREARGERRAAVEELKGKDAKKKSDAQIAKEEDAKKLKGATLRAFKPGASFPFPYCDKYRLGTCCGEKHEVPFSRLHAKPKALYKAVVDATTDDERAAAVAALEGRARDESRKRDAETDALHAKLDRLLAALDAKG